MKVSKSAMKIGQVFYEDDDFITLKISKRDDVSFDLGELGDEDEFFTLLFVRFENEVLEVWDPLEGR